MSYTMLDWLYDQCRDDQIPHTNCVKGLIVCLREDDRAVVRRGDMESLARFAASKGLDPADNAQWIAADEANDEVTGDALMALSNWRKEHKDWERP